jgi:hypothetical protein
VNAARVFLVGRFHGNIQKSNASLSIRSVIVRGVCATATLAGAATSMAMSIR